MPESTKVETPNVCVDCIVTTHANLRKVQNTELMCQLCKRRRDKIKEAILQAGAEHDVPESVVATMLGYIDYLDVDSTKSE